MGKQDVSIDPKVFGRTASRFAVKRGSFAPDAVEALADDIVRHLSRAARQGVRFENPVIREESVAAFCDALIQPDPDAALAFVEALRAEGMTRQGVYLGYIGAAARMLGERWDASLLSFVDVTIGTGHLYALMRALRAESREHGSANDTRRYALFATVPGETHGIGITVAADLFREAGWEIDLQLGTEQESLLARVERSRPQIIGLSLSTNYRLEDLARLVVALRFAAPQSIIGVAPGAELDDRTVTDVVDIDLLFHDPRVAVRELDRLLALRG